MGNFLENRRISGIWEPFCRGHTDTESLLLLNNSSHFQRNKSVSKDMNHETAFKILHCKEASATQKMIVRLEFASDQKISG